MCGRTSAMRRLKIDGEYWRSCNDIIIIMRIPALKCSSSMLRPQLRLCRMAWVRGEERESNKATNIYEIVKNNMKRTNLHMHDCTRMETTKFVAIIIVLLSSKQDD